MLLPEQILPFLNHADEDVRRHAAQYLGELADAAPPQSADELWKAIDTFGSQPGIFGAPESVFFLDALAAVPQNDSSIARALEMLSQPTRNENVTFKLFRYFATIPVQWLIQDRDQILPLLDIENRSALKHRLSLHEMPGEELWQRLLDIGIQAEAAENSSTVQNGVAVRIVEALCAHAQIAIPRAIEVLNDSEDRYWLKTWCIDLLGRLRHNPAIDLMIAAMMHDEGDFMHQSAGNALARLDPEQVVHKLDAVYDPSATENIYNRMRVPEALGKIKHPLAEAALLRLLERETNAEVIADISAALVNLCTTDGLEALRQVVIEERYDSAITNVMEELVTLAKMTDFHPPELEQWIKDLNETSKNRDLRRHFLGKMGVTEEQADLLRRLLKDKSPTDVAEMLRAPEPAALATLPVATLPYRRETPKVGRNDPCPCGSGKKYKKCCGQ